MADSKRKNAKGRKEGDKANSGESLQEAFKRFRKERQVNIPLRIYEWVIFMK